MSETKKKRRSRIGLLYFFLILITVGIATVLYWWLYQVSRQNVINAGKLSASGATKEIEYLLAEQKNAMELEGSMFSYMLENGISDDEIHNYMRMRSQLLPVVIENHSTGLYGVIRGKYVDGIDWVPDIRYDPFSRPWYTEAVEAGGEVALVSPYMDVKTGMLMMSLSVLLEDGESVLAIDIFLDELQELMVNITQDSNISHALIVDRDDYIVANSQTDRAGINLADLKDLYSEGLYAAYRASRDSSFEYFYRGQNYYVFNQKLYGTWNSLMLVDSHQLFADLRMVYLGALGTLLVIIVIIAIVVYDLNARRNNAERMNSEMERLFIASNTDRMTGFFNRRSYEENLEVMGEHGPDERLVYVTMDINGLKTTNDNLGHDVGDEMIRGASDCIRMCFGRYGKIFRIGGDEFAAVIHADEQELAKIREEFEYTVKGWRGEKIKRIAISSGYASIKEFPGRTIEELARVADQRMYENKKAYYEQDKRRENYGIR